jgi:hypothetical protein
MSLWERLFAAPVRPILLRVDGTGPAPASIVVDMTWLPSRERMTRTFVVSSGMALLPWRGESTAVELDVRDGGRVGSVDLTRRDNRDGEVVSVWLEPERVSQVA